MMPITVDRHKCQGYANCVVAAPDVFDLDSDGKVVVLQQHTAVTADAEVEEAVRSCPAAALKLERAV